MPLEADREQVGSVVSSEFEGASAANGCTRSLGGMEAPGTLEVTRFPSVIVPVCVVKCVSATTCSTNPVCGSDPVCEWCGHECAGVRASQHPCMSEQPDCVLPSTPCVKGAPRVYEATCAPETPRMCEQPRVSETPRVSVPV